jgi:hypothetical protein
MPYTHRYTVSPLDGYTTFRHNLEVWTTDTAGRRLTQEANITLRPDQESEERTIARQQRLAEVRVACPEPADSIEDQEQAARRLRALTWLLWNVGLSESPHKRVDP